MSDLLHWDYAVSFNGAEAAALAVGVDPNMGGIKWLPLYARMEVSYDGARVRDYPMGVPPPTSTACLESLDLCKYRDDQTPGAHSFFLEWVGSAMSGFLRQKFTRAELARWFAVSKIPSHYRFDLEKTEEVVESDIDPIDLPEELYAANLAFRAVTNGRGNPSATFKNRLISYLKTDFPGLSNEAVERIATVANPDKTTGRKKSSTQ